MHRVHWRPACAALSIAPDVIRRALAGRHVRIATATQIRMVLAAAGEGGTP